MRLFAALPLHPAATERLLQLRLRLASPRDGLRWSQPEQWHITVRFFGELSDAKISAVQRSLEQLQAAPPEVHIAALGLFPVKGILFAATEPTPGLLRLQAEVERLAAATGLMPETRPFHPHITLARSRNRTGLAMLRRLAEPTLPTLGPAIRWVAQEVVLFASELSPEGAVYEALARFPLQAHSDAAASEVRGHSRSSPRPGWRELRG